MCHVNVLFYGVVVVVDSLCDIIGGEGGCVVVVEVLLLTEPLVLP